MFFGGAAVNKKNKKNDKLRKQLGSKDLEQ